MSEATLLQSFELLATAPGGVVRLRELILTLAVQGKLVPQDPNDEPASVLLNRISAARKTALSKARSKSSSAYLDIREDDRPYEIPNGWAWARVGAIASVFNGNSINEDEKLKKYTNIRGGLPFIATKDVGYGRDELNYESGVSIPVGLEKFKVARKNAVLLCAEGGSAGRKIGVTDRDICFGNKLFASEVVDGVDHRFIFYVYQSPYFVDEFRKRMTGIIGGISIGEFVGIDVPLPPTAEQRRIANRVDDLMKLSDALEGKGRLADEQHSRLTATLFDFLASSGSVHALAENWKLVADHFDLLLDRPEAVDALEQTILQLAVRGRLVSQDPNEEPARDLLKRIRAEKDHLVVGGKTKREKPNPAMTDEENTFELPVGWEWAQLSEVAISGPTNGLSPRPQDVPTNVRCLSLSATTQGYFKPDCFKYVDVSPEVAEQYFLKTGDLLIQRGNSLDYVGIAAIYDGPDDAYIYPDLMMRLQLSQFVNAAFIHTALICVEGRSYFKRNATGTQGTMPKVNQATVAGTPIPLPPLAEQSRIVARIESLRSLCADLRKRLTLSQATQSKLAEALVSEVA